MLTRTARLPLSSLLPFTTLAALAPSLPGQDRDLRFSWPVPSVVDVTEERVQDGRSLLVRYRVALREGEDDELVVSRRDFKVLEVEDLDVTAFEQVVAPLLAQLGNRPDIRIDRDGRVLGVEAWETFARRLEQPVQDYVDRGALAADHAERILASMRSPETRASMLNRATEFWTLWVSGWLANDFTERAQLDVEAALPLPNGIVMTGPQRLRHHGPAEGRDGHVRLSMETVIRGENLMREVREMVAAQPVPTVPGVPRPIPAHAITEAELGNRAWVVVRPDTMQPLEAMTENRLVIEGDGEERITLDRRHFTFDWK